jgi:hypothetical protein
MSEKITVPVEEQIVANAVAPKIADIDGQRVEQHSIDDQIKAVQFAESMKAARSRKLGIRIAKMVHGGAE